NIAQVLGLKGDCKGAVTAAKRGFELDSDNPLSEACYAFALLYDQQWAEGFKAFEIRFKWRLHSFLQYPFPKWLGEENKTLFLVADQGLGDTLSYARFVHAAA